VHETYLAARKGIIKVKPSGYNTVGEMGSYVIFVKDRECMITDIDPVPFTGIKRLPGFVHRSGDEGRLKSFKTPVFIVNPCI